MNVNFKLKKNVDRKKEKKVLQLRITREKKKSTTNQMSRTSA